ncbi:hypothetical protein QG516_03395 [Pedobacter gandavensis]|nr:hypothetical protein [Pedobacter gandavensis]WGQ10699.1 hypothetical protein QG516_03395 [Pedobacter gandavensis]
MGILKWLNSYNFDNDKATDLALTEIAVSSINEQGSGRINRLTSPTA